MLVVRVIMVVEIVIYRWLGSDVEWVILLM